MPHTKRWISAIVLTLLLLWIILLSKPFVLCIFLWFMSILGLNEYFNLVFFKKPIGFIVKAISYIISAMLFISVFYGEFELTAFILCLNFFCFACFALWRYPIENNFLKIVFKQSFGIIYIPLSLSFLMIIRNYSDGHLWLVLFFIIIFLNDTGAFYVGTYFGKRELAPLISPKKTIEGALGGILSAMLFGFAFCLIFFNSLKHAFLMIPISFIIAIIGQAGDLFASLMKRNSNIKDSGNIIPGHGGVLDRIDNLLFAAPIMYFCLRFIL